MRIIICNGTKINLDNCTLEEAKKFRQEQNKEELATFLKSASVEFKGKRYGVTEEDQSEMQAMVMQYQMLTAAGIESELRWHAKYEECETFSLEEMVALVAQIKAFVLPHMSLMQECKSNIFKAKTVDEAMSTKIFST